MMLPYIPVTFPVQALMSAYERGSSRDGKCRRSRARGCIESSEF